MADMPLTPREEAYVRRIHELERTIALMAGEAQPLTKREHQLLVCIVEMTDANGVCPSYGELVAELELASKSNIHRLLGVIEKKGWIRRTHYGVRSIVVLHRPDMPDVSDPEFTLAPELVAAAQ